MITDRASRATPSNRTSRFIRDQRGAVAFEMLFVYSFLLFSLLLPLADVAMAGFKFISAWQSLRGFGQSIQYNPPADVTSASSWVTTATGKADSRYPISTINLICGDAMPRAPQPIPHSPKYYSYSTTRYFGADGVEVGVVHEQGSNACTFTLPYSERFQ